MISASVDLARQSLLVPSALVELNSSEVLASGGLQAAGFMISFFSKAEEKKITEYSNMCEKRRALWKTDEWDEAKDAFNDIKLFNGFLCFLHIWDDDPQWHCSCWNSQNHQSVNMTSFVLWVGYTCATVWKSCQTDIQAIPITVFSLLLRARDWALNLSKSQVTSVHYHQSILSKVLAKSCVHPRLWIC